MAHMGWLVKTAIAAGITVLFALFVFASIEAAYPAPERADFCDSDPQPRLLGQERNCSELTVPANFTRQCEKKDGRVAYEHEDGCRTDYYCETCHAEYTDARERHNRVAFLVVALVSLAVIVASLVLRPGRELDAVIATGFLFGALLSLFWATGQYIGDLTRLLRPFVLLGELCVVIAVAYITQLRR